MNEPDPKLLFREMMSAICLSQASFLFYITVIGLAIDGVMHLFGSEFKGVNFVFSTLLGVWFYLSAWVIRRSVLAVVENKSLPADKRIILLFKSMILVPFVLFLIQTKGKLL